MSFINSFVGKSVFRVEKIGHSTSLLKNFVEVVSLSLLGGESSLSELINCSIRKSVLASTLSEVSSKLYFGVTKPTLPKFSLFHSNGNSSGEETLPTPS